VRAKASPAWAIDELGRLVKGDAVDEARRCARTLLPSWRVGGGAALGPPFLGKVATLARVLDDPGLASGLLAPLGPDRITARNVGAVLAMAEHYGLEWSKDLFARWTERRRYESSPVLPVLPLLAGALATHRWAGARTLGETLLAREIAAFRTLAAALRESLATRDGVPARDELVRDAGVLLDAAGALDAPGPSQELLRTLMGKGVGLPPMVLAAVLRRAQARRTPEPLRRLGLGALQAYVEAALRESLARSAPRVNVRAARGHPARGTPGGTRPSGGGTGEAGVRVVHRGAPRSGSGGGKGLARSVIRSIDAETAAPRLHPVVAGGASRGFASMASTSRRTPRESSATCWPGRAS
jgi:hypothetical protein